ncbi:g1211 [Coccomyxa elongata]
MVSPVVFYYYSDDPAQNLMARPSYAGNQACFSNLLGVFGTGNLTVLTANLYASSVSFLQGLVPASQMVALPSTGSAAAFLQMLTMLGGLAGAALVYFVDGPTLHTPDALTCLSEGSQIADYCTLYDSPAMYTGSGTVSPTGLVGNFYLFQGGETTRVVVTGSAHWKYTHTPTLNIAATVERLLQEGFCLMPGIKQKVCVHKLGHHVQRGCPTLDSGGRLSPPSTSTPRPS